MGLFCCFSSALLSCSKMFQQDKTWRVSVLCGNFPVFRFGGRKCSYNNNFSQSYLCWKTFKTNLGKSESFVIIEKIFCLISFQIPVNLFQVMKDSQLFLVVGVLLTIDITIMTTWHLADPFYREIQQLKSYVSIETFCSNDNYSL